MRACCGRKPVSMTFLIRRRLSQGIYDIHQLLANPSRWLACECGSRTDRSPPPCPLPGRRVGSPSTDRSCVEAEHGEAGDLGAFLRGRPDNGKARLGIEELLLLFRGFPAQSAVAIHRLHVGLEQREDALALLGR
ncbi:hypothetical protein L1887_56503 [Cichorium endivia]|nr:hypothetical protein L1887_56503 [Cichorium endivia]